MKGEVDRWKTERKSEGVCETREKTHTHRDTESERDRERGEGRG